MAQARPKYGIGASALRFEDARFIRGLGTFTDYLKPAGCLHAHVVHSPHANATFTIKAAEKAKAALGVVLILSVSDIAHLGSLKTSQLPQGPGKNCVLP